MHDLAVCAVAVLEELHPRLVEVLATVAEGIGKRLRRTEARREQPPILLARRHDERRHAFLEGEGELCAEELLDVLLAAPVEWGAGALRRLRLERRHHLEHLADAAVGTPVDERDPSSAARHPPEFTRRR